MKAVRTLQKYKCDFCKKRSTKSVMERHEQRCFRNPNRYCDFCQNKGFTIGQPDEVNHHWITQEYPCPYCSRFNKETLAEIEAREKGEKPTEPLSDSAIPF